MLSININDSDSTSDVVNSILILLMENKRIENSDFAKHEVQYSLRMDHKLFGVPILCYMKAIICLAKNLANVKKCVICLFENR